MNIKTRAFKNKYPPLINFVGFILGLLLISSCTNKQIKTTESSLPLLNKLGTYHYPISTSSPAAQNYFDQGLIQTFGFNHAEAGRSFKEASRLDPGCALCYWGEALVLGPNINAPMDPSVAQQAYQLVQKSLALSSGSTDKERALINALSVRYAKIAPDDRNSLDKAYADAMHDVVLRFPDDALITSLYAEALMDLHPWNFWTKQGEIKPWTAEIITTLEQAIQIDADNPLANHLYIHIMEASPHPEKALASAKRLPALVPGSGHLVHMPAHIYIRIGRYHDVILANQQAVKVDQRYLKHNHAESIYTMAYVPHNHHFLWAAAIKTGRKQLALNAATDTASHINHDMLRTPGFSGTLQHFLVIPLYTQALFGDWDTILAEPAPAADLIYPTGIWHYARGLALIRKGNPEAAKLEIDSLQQNIADPAIANLSVFDLNLVTSLMQIGADILQAELAIFNKDYPSALTYLQHAIELEDGLNYTEPKDWYLPPRQVLGEVLLMQGKARQAEQIYREDLHYHPQNGWSLFGLLTSLREQGKNNEADTVQKQFDTVWADADITLTSTRF